MHRRRLALVGVCLALSVACANDGDGTSADATGTPRETGTATTTPEDQTWTIRVEVRHGEVVGGPQRVRMDLGDEVVLIVSSDVADEVHVHGYDERAGVKARSAVRMEFIADAPGVFVVELEEHKLHLAELEVR